jgi:hypothetical protein
LVSGGLVLLFLKHKRLDFRRSRSVKKALRQSQFLDLLKRLPKPDGCLRIERGASPFGRLLQTHVGNEIPRLPQQTREARKLFDRIVRPAQVYMAHGIAEQADKRIAHAPPLPVSKDCGISPQRFRLLERTLGARLLWLHHPNPETAYGASFTLQTRVVFVTGNLRTKVRI